MSETRSSLKRILLGLIVVLGFYWILSLPSLYGDFLWFQEVGYESVFLTILTYRIGLFLISAAVTFLVLYAGYHVAVSKIEKVSEYSPPWTYWVGIIGFSILVGLQYSGAWDIILRFLHATPFGVTEPIYGREVAFYVYTLPIINLIVGFLFLVTTTSFLLSVALYARPFGVTEHPTPSGNTQVEFDLVKFAGNIREHAYTHMITYVGVFVVLVGIKYYIDRFELLYSNRGAVFGVGATDLVVFKPLLGLLAITAVIGGLVILGSTRFGDERGFYIPIAIIIGFLLVGNGAGFVYQDFVVEPDEFNKEAEYLTDEIEFTNQAYALNEINEREFPVSPTLTAEQIQNNPGTIENIRLWDPRPLLTTYNELQIFRTYYRFNDVDIDRYDINGEETQVMLSAREVEFNDLPPESRSWVNRHLVYTHGFGVAMSPVSQITSQGLPELYIKDIPPNSTVGIDITQPRIYYGELTDTYTIVDTETRELDYPSGNQNVYNNYDGGGGVVLNSGLREFIYSAKFGAPQIFLSQSVTSESRIQFNRDIETRASTIAPFLEYDDDPYIVVSNGKLYWMYDAYTTTNQYPYSQRMRFKDGQANYVRNSVKVVINAYTGETTYYVAEPNDPLIQTYQKAFPSMFQSINDMPPDLRQHIRYPEDAFQIQADLYLDYHMKDPMVFYNKEDSWQIPDEVARGQQIPMEPYYIIMTLPGEETPEFVMIQPYIPEGRQNMIGWLAARSDPPEYGNLEAILFSKQQLVFGPMQIESRIDQDATISQQITLWSQSGSSVIRGNLLAIPIGDTIIYIEPLFLESQEEGALPELTRVIVAQGELVTMQPTLSEAFSVRFGAAPPGEPGAPGTGSGLSPSQLQEARTLYNEAQTALQNGDFTTYAQKITELGELLEELEAQQSDESTSQTAAVS